MWRGSSFRNESTTARRTIFVSQTAFLELTLDILKPPVVLYQRVFPFKPPKADPLLPAWDVNEYRISPRPCGPGLRMLEIPNPFTDEIAVNVRIARGNTRATNMAILTS